MKPNFTFRSKLLFFLSILCSGFLFAQNPGDLDTSFNTLNAQFQANAGTNNTVNSIAMQPMAKLL